MAGVLGVGARGARTQLGIEMESSPECLIDYCTTEQYVSPSPLPLVCARTCCASGCSTGRRRLGSVRKVTVKASSVPLQHSSNRNPKSELAVYGPEVECLVYTSGVV